MKQGKNPTLFVLVLEIAAIVVLHAVKISQSEKTSNNKEISRNASSAQPESKTKSSYSLASFR
ncbi:MAG TPA: hypothetical protein VK563_13930 [Puia sp.]|nr:hypothetical protein [Puia sp.]